MSEGDRGLLRGKEKRQWDIEGEREKQVHVRVWRGSKSSVRVSESQVERGVLRREQGRQQWDTVGERKGQDKREMGSSLRKKEKQTWGIVGGARSYLEYPREEVHIPSHLTIDFGVARYGVATTGVAIAGVTVPPPLPL